MSQALLPGIEFYERRETLLRQGRCMRCGRRLIDKDSVRCGIGPRCREVQGLALRRRRGRTKRPG